MYSLTKVGYLILVGLVIVSGLAPGASAQVLTAAGVADGFTLTTFATLDPGNTGCCSGPFGIAVASNGNILVDNNLTSSIYAFTDTDGQTIASALSTHSSNSFVIAYATAG